MDLITSLSIILGVIILTAIIIYFFSRQYRKAGPNEILIVSGGKKSKLILPDGSEKVIGFKFSIGGGSYVSPITQSVFILPVEVVSIHSKLTDVLSKNGISLSLEFSAQVKINTEAYPMYQAITNFINKGTQGILETSQTVLESKVRELAGTFAVEELFSQSNRFTESLDKEIDRDFSELGLLLVSFGLSEIKDAQGYIEALSKPYITKAKYQADVDQAEKDRDLTIKAAQASKEGKIARLKAEAEVAGASWHNEAKKAESQVMVNQRKAQADMAYEVERYKLQQSLKKEEFAVKKIELEESTKLEELQIKKKEKELQANILKPAEARSQQVKMEADAESYRLETESKGKMTAKKTEDMLEAERIRLLGKAEADSIAEKARSYQSYNQAAIYQMIMEKMPELAKAISEPLSKVDKIVMIESDGKLGGSKITGQVTDILAQLPEVVEALTGADIKEFLKKKFSADEK